MVKRKEDENGEYCGIDKSKIRTPGATFQYIYLETEIMGLDAIEWG